MNPNHFSILTIASLFLSTSTTLLTAQSVNTSKPADKPRTEARFFNQTTPFAGEITRGIIVAETNQFSFVVPPGFRRQFDAAAKKISLTSTSYTCSITAILHESAIEGKADLKPDSVRQLLISRYKNARVVDEFNASIESMSGPAFELEWPAESGLMSTRAAFVPYPGGHIEVTVQAPASEFRAYDQSLFQLLMSFRTSPVGTKLAVQEYLSEL